MPLNHEKAICSWTCQCHKGATNQENWFWEENVCPNFHVEGTTLENCRVFPSTKLSLNESFWPRRSMLLCQFAPQFLCMGTQLLKLEPVIHTAFTSPLPPTLEIITMLKFDCPFKVKRTPPLLLHETLQLFTHLN